MSSAVAEDVRESLLAIRDRAPSARNTAGGGALLRELHEVCCVLNDGAELEDLKDRVTRSQILRKPAYQSRIRIWRALSYRYIEPGCRSCVGGLADAARSGVGSPEFTSLAYLYFALRDRMTFEFVTTWVCEKWARRQTNLDRGDYLGFLDQMTGDYPQVTRWKESTRKKLASNTFTALRDFGLLKGARKRQIQRPATAHETVYQLLRILHAEGLEGRAVLEAPDWRLFLWSSADVARVLGELAQRGWLRFEKAGRTVILQLNRQTGMEG